MKTIAIAAQKGGVGKTATTAAIGAGLHRAGLRVLCVDADPQANLSTQLEANMQGVTLSDVLVKQKTRGAIQDTAQGAIIAADSFLSNRDVFAGRNPEYRLKTALEPVKGNYDVCLIDCPPSLGMLTIAALTAADAVIIPCKADRFSLDALNEIAGTIKTVQANTNKNLHVYGVLITMYFARSTIHRLMLDELKEQAEKLGYSVYDPPIRRAIAVEEAQYGGTVYDTRNGAAEDYQRIVDTLITQLKGE